MATYILLNLCIQCGYLYLQSYFEQDNNITNYHRKVSINIHCVNIAQQLEELLEEQLENIPKKICSKRI